MSNHSLSNLMLMFTLTLQENSLDVHCGLFRECLTIESMCVANVSHSASMTHSCMHHSTINFDPLHSTPYFIGKTFPATVATVKCPSDCNNCTNSYNCLTFNRQTSLHTVTQCQKLFSEPLLLVLCFFSPPSKIWLVSHIQMAFTRCKQSGYARLGKMDFQCPVHAVKKSFGSWSVWKTSLFRERLLLTSHACRILHVLSKEKSIR